MTQPTLREILSYITDPVFTTVAVLAVGTFVALASKDDPLTAWQAIKTMFIGIAVAGFGGAFLTAIAHGWWPHVNGLAIAGLSGFVLGFVSVGTVPELARRSGDFARAWLNSKSGGGQP
jgi:hypothetical protein